MRMEHRGGCACDNDTGDGAGVLTGVPHQLYARALRYAQASLPVSVRQPSSKFGPTFLSSQKGLITNLLRLVGSVPLFSVLKRQT